MGIDMLKRSIKKTALIGIIVLFVFSTILSACQKQNTGIEWRFTRTIAREFQKDGWCYSFSYERMKNPLYEFNGHIHYTFSAINLRYQYHPDYIMTYYREEGDRTFVQKYVPGILIWGNGGIEQKEDTELIMNEILVQTRSVADLLSLNPDDYEFKTIDKNLFFRLMKDALSGATEPEKETQKQLYVDKPTYAMLSEPEYLDGYKFQVAFLVGMGYVDEIYIDVLFQTGPEYTDYVQLSDMVEGETANEQQLLAFDTIQKIASAIRGTDDFLTSAELYQDLKIEQLDFSRLYMFMKAIHENEYISYSSVNRLLSSEEIQKQ